MQLIRTVGREEAAKWLAAPRDETADYCTNFQKKLAFIERNADEPDREAVSAVLETFTNAKPPSSKRMRKNEPRL
jgi:hypothetical protein